MKIAANISTLFRDRPLLERFDAARTAGFDEGGDAIPYAESADALASAARDAGMPTVLINAPLVLPAHPMGIAGRPDMRREFREQLPKIVQYAAALKVRFVHVLAGASGAARDLDSCWATYVDNLLLAADALEPHGVTVLVEPLNEIDAPGYLLGSYGEAHTILARCRNRVGLQFDAYHCARMGLDPAAEFTRYGPSIRHVQFADVPGRHEPGTGTLQFAPLLAAMRAARYTGWLSAEYNPARDTHSGLGWLRDWRSADAGAYS